NNMQSTSIIYHNISKISYYTTKPVEVIVDGIFALFSKAIINLDELSRQKNPKWTAAHTFSTAILISLILGYTILLFTSSLFRQALKIYSYAFFLLKLRNWTFQFASYKGYETLVKVILLLGADPNKKNFENFASIHYASRSGNSNILKILLESGADPNLPGGRDFKHGYDLEILPLDRAILSGDVETVNTLIPLSSTPLKDTYLLDAARLNVDLFKMLVNKQGLNPKTKILDKTLVYSVCKDRLTTNSIEVLRFLLEECQLDVNESSNESGITPLHLLACSYRNQQKNEYFEPVVQLLLKHQANINAKTIDGNTCLHFAAREVNIRFLNILRSSPQWNQLDKAPVNNLGETPLQYSFVSRYHIPNNFNQVVTFYVKELNADLNVLDLNGCSLLHKIASNDLEDQIEVKELQILFDHGIKVYEDQMGRTPMHAAFIKLASSSCGTAMATFLFEKGLDLNAQDKEGRTPLHLAICEFKKVNLYDYKTIIDSIHTLASMPSIDLNVQDSQGRTVYHLSAIASHEIPGLYNLLNQIKPDSLITDNLGFSALDYKNMNAQERVKYFNADTI
ncbi:MAG: ankyrin repeat domain-containing protein, partial [Parachlamydiaceae bacterium]|nr:ankyrin repeat domain-containing protein [Parachlamydiaceae bacterium]